MDFETRHIRGGAAKDLARNLFLQQPIQIPNLAGVDLVGAATCLDHVLPICCRTPSVLDSK